MTHHEFSDDDEALRASTQPVRSVVPQPQIHIGQADDYEEGYGGEGVSAPPAGPAEAAERATDQSAATTALGQQAVTGAAETRTEGQSQNTNSSLGGSYGAGASQSDSENVAQADSADPPTTTRAVAMSEPDDRIHARIPDSRAAQLPSALSEPARQEAAQATLEAAAAEAAAQEPTPATERYARLAHHSETATVADAVEAYQDTPEHEALQATGNQLTRPEYTDRAFTDIALHVTATAFVRPGEQILRGEVVESLVEQAYPDAQEMQLASGETIQWVQGIGGAPHVPDGLIVKVDPDTGETTITGTVEARYGNTAAAIREYLANENLLERFRALGLSVADDPRYTIVTPDQGIHHDLQAVPEVEHIRLGFTSQAFVDEFVTVTHTPAEGVPDIPVEATNIGGRNLQQQLQELYGDRLGRIYANFLSAEYHDHSPDVAETVADQLLRGEMELDHATIDELQARSEASYANPDPAVAQAREQLQAFFDRPDPRSETGGTYADTLRENGLTLVLYGSLIYGDPRNWDADLALYGEQAPPLEAQEALRDHLLEIGEALQEYWTGLTTPEGHPRGTPSFGTVDYLSEFGNPAQVLVRPFASIEIESLSMLITGRPLLAQDAETMPQLSRRAHQIITNNPLMSGLVNGALRSTLQRRRQREAGED